MHPNVIDWATLCTWVITGTWVYTHEMWTVEETTEMRELRLKQERVYGPGWKNALRLLLALMGPGFLLYYLITYVRINLERKGG